VIKEIPQKKYWYPCEETNNEDGTTTLQAVFVDCAGTAIVGRKETSRVCQKVVDFAVALSEERGLPLIFWTGGNPYEYEQIFKKDGYGHFQVFDKPESYNRQQGKPKDFVTIMIDDIIKEYIAKRCEVIPSEYHCAYDICPEHFREIS
ncbi:MAG: hypothetical protein NTW79_00410, partial [Candidatus Berkelbacteria bacterium]|nr:hypothetical protein [Candidatus Berkelbacteria bacterium]